MVDSYGEYFVFDNPPYHLMEQMIIEFRCYRFDHKYDRQCSNICAGNILPPEGQKSTYWMFENESRAKTKVDWTTNSQLDSKEIGTVNHMKNYYLMH